MGAYHKLQGNTRPVNATHAQVEEIGTKELVNRLQSGINVNADGIRYYMIAMINGPGNNTGIGGGGHGRFPTQIDRITGIIVNRNVGLV
jgi:hypothetical protein